MVLSFARSHAYLLSIDTETVWFVASQSCPGKPHEREYGIHRLLIEGQVTYHSVIEISKDAYRTNKESEDVDVTGIGIEEKTIEDVGPDKKVVSRNGNIDFVLENDFDGSFKYTK